MLQRVMRFVHLQGAAARLIFVTGGIRKPGARMHPLENDRMCPPDFSGRCFAFHHVPSSSAIFVHFLPRLTPSTHLHFSCQYLGPF